MSLEIADMQQNPSKERKETASKRGESEREREKTDIIFNKEVKICTNDTNKWHPTDEIKNFLRRNRNECAANLQTRSFVWESVLPLNSNQIVASTNVYTGGDIGDSSYKKS